jgi:hypothetical protein
MEITLPQLQAEIAQLQANYGEMEARQEMIDDTKHELETANIHLIEAFASGIYSIEELEESQRKNASMTAKLLQLIELAPLQLQTRVELVDDGYTFHMTLGPNKILFQTDSHTETCIKIFIEDEIHLANYYFGTDIKRCPHIPHAVFFKLLAKIGVLYNKDVTLTDASTKQIEHTDCDLAATLFSLSGKPTFYERFGFVSEEYTAFIKETQPMPFAVFVKRAGYTQDANYVTMLRVLRTLDLTEQSTMRHIAKTIVTKCTKTSVRKSRQVKSTRSGFSRKTSSYAMASTKNVAELANYINVCFGLMVGNMRRNDIYSFRLRTAV